MKDRKVLNVSKRLSSSCWLYNTGIRSVNELVLKHVTKNCFSIIQFCFFDFAGIVISQALSGSNKLSPHPPITFFVFKINDL